MAYQLFLGTNPVQIMDHTIDGHDRLLQIGEGGKLCYNFRFFKLMIYKMQSTEIEGATNCKIQFTRFQFYSDDGSIYQYPDSTKMTIKHPGITAFSSEGFTNALNGAELEKTDKYGNVDGKKYGRNPKFCAKFNLDNDQTEPIDYKYVICDLGEGNYVNLKYFRNWRWCLANDSQQSSSRNMKWFGLQFSETGKDGSWIIPKDGENGIIKINSVENPKDWGIGFHGKINLY